MMKEMKTEKDVENVMIEKMKTETLILTTEKEPIETMMGGENTEMMTVVIGAKKYVKNTEEDTQILMKTMKEVIVVEKVEKKID